MAVLEGVGHRWDSKEASEAARRSFPREADPYVLAYKRRLKEKAEAERREKIEQERLQRRLQFPPETLGKHKPVFVLPAEIVKSNSPKVG